MPWVSTDVNANAMEINGVASPSTQWLTNDQKSALAQRAQLDAGSMADWDHMSLAELNKMDIGNSKYVRPDVWKFVDENIGQVP